jgi:hypothetical protein
MMNIDAASSWPLMVVALPGDKALQNESMPPIFYRNHNRPVILNSGSEKESNKFREKGSVVDIYI